MGSALFDLLPQRGSLRFAIVQHRAFALIESLFTRLTLKALTTLSRSDIANDVLCLTRRF